MANAMMFEEPSQSVIPEVAKMWPGFQTNEEPPPDDEDRDPPKFYPHRDQFELLAR